MCTLEIMAAVEPLTKDELLMRGASPFNCLILHISIKFKLLLFVPVSSCKLDTLLNFTGFMRFFISYLYAATVDSMTCRYSIYGYYKLL